MTCSDLWECLALVCFVFAQVLKSIYYQAKNFYVLGQGLEKVFFRAFHRSLTMDKLARPQFLLGI